MVRKMKAMISNKLIGKRLGANKSKVSSAMYATETNGWVRLQQNPTPLGSNGRSSSAA